MKVKFDKEINDMTDEVWNKFYSATEEEFNELPYLTIGKLRECIDQLPKILDDDPIKIITKSSDRDTAGVIHLVRLINDDGGLELYTTRLV